jgi:hypothetical protein
MKGVPFCFTAMQNLGSKTSSPCHAVICFKHNVQMLKAGQETACQVSLPLVFGLDLDSVPQAN